MTKSKLLLPALVLVVVLVFPVAASATLTFTKFKGKGLGSALGIPYVWVANDNGFDAEPIGRGTNPHVSPDGQSVVFLHDGAKNTQELKLAPIAGPPIRTLMTNFREASSLAWSPDSKTIAALRGPEIGKRTLVLIDVASGKQSVIAGGYFGGFSFSPDGSEIAYSVAQSENYPPRSDVFRFPVPIPGVVNVRASEPVRLTKDRRSSDPLWGPTGEIVFVKTVEGKKRKYAPKNELFLMNPQGKQVRRLTHTKVPPLLQGLFPTDWSANGTRLLAEFEGQDTSYAVTVDPKTGVQRPVAGTGENGFVGTALSVNGRFVLGYTGGFDPGSRHNVVSIPYEGGRATILARNAFEPDWVYYEYVAKSG
jgi:dipeptidyl aminopeptidase/acylaminoacyl peptidase